MTFKVTRPVACGRTLHRYGEHLQMLWIDGRHLVAARFCGSVDDEAQASLEPVSWRRVLALAAVLSGRVRRAKHNVAADRSPAVRRTYFAAEPVDARSPVERIADTAQRIRETGRP